MNEFVANTPEDSTKGNPYTDYDDKTLLARAFDLQKMSSLAQEGTAHQFSLQGKLVDIWDELEERGLIEE